MEIFVQYDEICEFYQRGNDIDCEWSADYSFSVNSATLISQPDKQEQSFNIPYLVNNGDNIYVLSLVYDEGDSCGMATGRGEIIWLFNDIKLAEHAKTKYENAAINLTNKVTFDIDSTGTTITLNNICNDYRSCMRSLNIDNFVIEEIV